MGEGREARAVRTSLAVIFPRTDLGQLSVVLISIIQLELEVQYHLKSSTQQCLTTPKATQSTGER
jgi:hypothetical protein